MSALPAVGKSRHQCANALDKDEWIAQVALRLSGAAPSSATAASPQELSQKLVGTAMFAESFADRIAAYWLKGTAEADPKHPAGKQLRSYLAQQIVAKKPWKRSACIDD